MPGRRRGRGLLYRGSGGRRFVTRKIWKSGGRSTDRGRSAGQKRDLRTWTGRQETEDEYKRELLLSGNASLKTGTLQCRFSLPPSIG